MPLYLIIIGVALFILRLATLNKSVAAVEVVLVNVTFEPVRAIAPELAAAQVNPPPSPDWACKNCPLVGALLTSSLASTIESSAIV